MRTNSIGSPITNENFAARARALAIERFGLNYDSNQLSVCQDEIMKAARGEAKANFNLTKSPVIDVDAMMKRGSSASQGPRAGAAAREMAKARPDLYAEARTQRAAAELGSKAFARLARERAMEIAGGPKFDHIHLSKAQNEIAKEHPELLAQTVGRSRAAVNDPNPDLDPSSDPGLLDVPAGDDEEGDGKAPCVNCNGAGELPDGEECPECDGTGRVALQRQRDDETAQPSRQLPKPQPSGQRANITTWSYEELNTAVRQGRATYKAVVNEAQRRARMPARSKPIEKMSADEKRFFFQPRVVAEMERQLLKRAR